MLKQVWMAHADGDVGGGGSVGFRDRVGCSC